MEVGVSLSVPCNQEGIAVQHCGRPGIFRLLHGYFVVCCIANTFGFHYL